VVFAPLQHGTTCLSAGSRTSRVARPKTSTSRALDRKALVGANRPPLLGFARSPPSGRPRASTPGRDVTAASFGFEQPARSLVPSSRFRTSSTVCSARSARACCIPLPISTSSIGFRRFLRSGVRRVSRPAIPTVGRLDPPGRSPQRKFPLEGFPSSVAAPCRHGRCLLAVVRSVRRDLFQRSRRPFRT